MSAWLGPVGGLIEFVHYQGAVKTKHDREVTLQTTIGGGRFALTAPATNLRSWAVSTEGIDSSQWAAFDALRSGAYGDRNYFLSPLAQVTNLITPAKSMPGMGGETAGVNGDALAGGLMFTPEGIRVPSMISGGGAAYLRVDVPVRPGTQVTGSVYVAGSGVQVRSWWVDAALKHVSVSSWPVVTSTELTRAANTTTVPEDAHAVYITVTGATAIAAPAVTWTDTARPWTVGRGCDNAIISDVSESEVLAGRWNNQQAADFDFTVTEVGAGA